MSRRSFLANTAKVLSLSALAAQFPRLSFAHSDGTDTGDHHIIDQLHQIIIVDDMEMPRALPEPLQAAMAQFRLLYPSAAHTVWTGAMLREFLFSNFGPDVGWAFDTLKPYAYKCDLARYCLLHKLGGLYSDLGTLHRAQWTIPKMFRTAAFREHCLENPGRFEVSNGILWSLPGSPALERAINQIIEHCRARFIGNRAIDPTGPGLLGWAWASAYADQWKSGAKDDHYLGISEIANLPTGPEMTFLPTANIRAPIALRPLRCPGDPSYLEGAGTNNYLKMWHARDIYG